MNPKKLIQLLGFFPKENALGVFQKKYNNYIIEIDLEKQIFYFGGKIKIGKKVDPFNDFQGIMSRAKTARRPEVFIKHYLDNYGSPSNPPAWMSFELLTMGDLSHLYKGLRNKADKKMIANFFEVHPTVFTSWLHTLTYVRNICAHHSRLWNKDLAIEPEKLLKPVGPWLSKPFENNKRVFYFISVLRYMLKRANPGTSPPYPIYFHSS